MWFPALPNEAQVSQPISPENAEFVALQEKMFRSGVEMGRHHYDAPVDRPSTAGVEEATDSASRASRSVAECASSPSSFLIFFGAGAIWSAATPLLAAPDEPSQIIKAASVVRGVWTAYCYVDSSFPGGAGGPKGCPFADPSNAYGFEEVLPQFYNLVRSPDADEKHSQICFTKKADIKGAIPASCARSLNKPLTAAAKLGGYTEFNQTYQARYPPEYYAVVGLPSLFNGSTIDLYLMRLVSAALSPIFLALACSAALIYSRNRLIIVGLALGATPMVFFLASVVNSSGLECSSAIAFWTAGVILFTERLATPPRGLIAIAAFSAGVFESARALSPFWLALSAVALLACVNWAALTSGARSHSLWLGTGFVVVVGVLAVWWILAEHATDLYFASNPGIPASVPMSTILKTAFEHNAFYLPDMVGVFGWFDTYAPVLTYVIWYGLVCVAIIGAALRSIRRGAVLILMFGAVLALPVVIEASHAHTYGYTWSGRDALPFAVGLPILAAATLGAPGKRSQIAAVARRVTPYSILVLAVAQFLAFYESVRRYAVGTTGPVFGFLTHPDWQPAISNIGALVLEITALVALSALYLWSFQQPIETADDPSNGAPLAAGVEGSGSRRPSVAARIWRR